MPCRASVSPGRMVKATKVALGSASRMPLSKAAMIASSPRFPFPTWPRIPIRRGAFSRILGGPARRGDEGRPSRGARFRAPGGNLADRAHQLPQESAADGDASPENRAGDPRPIGEGKGGAEARPHVLVLMAPGAHDDPAARRG